MIPFAPRLERFAQLTAFAAFALVIALAISHHEPWSDEAQSWLLARDASLSGLWTQLMHYEGSPGLWQTLLHILIRCSLPYHGLNAISGVFGLAAAAVLIKFAPLPLPVRLLLPFTFFLCYQYSVIARNYSLFPLLLFATAAVLQNRGTTARPALLISLLCLIAAVSAQAYLISICIWAIYCLPHIGQKNLLTASAIYAVVLTLIAVSCWPRHDATFIGSPELSFHHLYELSKYAFQQAFGDGYLPWLIVGLSLPMLLKGGGWLFFLLASIALCGFGSVVYSNVWHHGFLLLAWLFAIWMSAIRTKPDLPALAALATMIAVQCYWTAAAVRYDWSNPYSGSLAAARYLQPAINAHAALFAAGFPSVALQPYFSNNIFRNYSHPYWQWSKENTTDDSIEHLGSAKPDYVVAGFSSESQRKLWSYLITSSGFRYDKTFPGHLFWHADVWAPESFDIYKRGPVVRDSSLASVVAMGDSADSVQLMDGFYAISNNAWRWTAKDFHMVLQRPSGAGSHGAELVLKLFVPDEEIARLRKLTLTVSVAGKRLHPFAIRAAGAFDAVFDVPASALYWEMVPVECRLNKAMPPSKLDARELGVVISSAGLFPNK